MPIKGTLYILFILSGSLGSGAEYNDYDYVSINYIQGDKSTCIEKAKQFAEAKQIHLDEKREFEFFCVRINNNSLLRGLSRSLLFDDSEDRGTVIIEKID